MSLSQLPPLSISQPPHFNPYGRNAPAIWPEWVASIEAFISSRETKSANQRRSVMLYCGGTLLQELYEVLSSGGNCDCGSNPIDVYQTAVHLISCFLYPKAKIEKEEEEEDDYDEYGDDYIEVHYVNYPPSVAIKPTIGLTPLVSSQDGNDDLNDFHEEEVRNYECPHHGLDETCQHKTDALTPLVSSQDGNDDLNDFHDEEVRNYERPHHGLDETCQHKTDALTPLVSSQDGNDDLKDFHEEVRIYEGPHHGLDEDCEQPAAQEPAADPDDEQQTSPVPKIVKTCDPDRNPRTRTRNRA